jgi:hypothetical protein
MKRWQKQSKIDTSEEPLAAFPSSPYVYHFHPLGFIRQMKNMYDQLIWGSKVSQEFKRKVLSISQELWPDDYLEMANNLMAIMAFESGETFDPGVPNGANSEATGLIQFMPDTAAGLLGRKKEELTIETTPKGLKRIKEFADMTAVKQLEYVKKYFIRLKGKQLRLIDLYLFVLFPPSVGKPYTHVVFASKKDLLDDSNDINADLRVRAYAPNKGLDTNNDGKITVEEILSTCIQPKYNKGKSYIE